MKELMKINILTSYKRQPNQSADIYIAKCNEWGLGKMTFDIGLKKIGLRHLILGEASIVLPNKMGVLNFLSHSFLVGHIFQTSFAYFSKAS